MFTSTGPDGDLTTLRLAGEIDIAVAEDLFAAARECLDVPAAAALRVDLAEVTFLDSSGLGALVRTRNYAQSLTKGLEIVNVSESVMKVFRITGLGEALNVEPAAGGPADG